MDNDTGAVPLAQAPREPAPRLPSRRRGNPQLRRWQLALRGRLGQDRRCKVLRRVYPGGRLDRPADHRPSAEPLDVPHEGAGDLRSVDHHQVGAAEHARRVIAAPAREQWRELGRPELNEPPGMRHHRHEPLGPGGAYERYLSTRKGLPEHPHCGQHQDRVPQRTRPHDGYTH